MIRLTCRLALVLVALVVLATVPSRAQPAPGSEFVRTLADKYYNPSSSGLRDFEVVVRNPRFEKLLPGAVIRIYWKGPDRKRARIENAPEKVREKVPELERKLAAIADDIVPEGILELARKREVGVTTEGELTHVSLTPHPGSADPTNHYWFDKELRMTRSVSELMVQGRPQRTDFNAVKVIDQEGRFLVAEMKGSSPAGSAEIRWEYEKLGGFWLPTKMVHVTGRNDVETTLFLDYKVNQGLGDDVFQ